MTRRIIFAALLTSTCLWAAHISAQNSAAQKAGEKAQPTNDESKKGKGMTTDQAVFGRMPDGKEVKIYTLTNGAGSR